jgi:hypothetical protein
MFNHNYLFEYWSILPILGLLFAALFFLDIVLRAVSLWRAARANQIAWFIALLVLNTMAILPIIYLIFFAQNPLYKDWQKQAAPAKKTTKRKKR